VYHSVYDTYEWMAKYGDPGFLYHAAMAKYAGLLALRFANADALPFDAAAYGLEIARYADELRALPAASPHSVALSALAQKARAWSAAAGLAQKAIFTRLHERRTPTPDLRDANAWLQSLERAVLDAPGIPGRPWFRHLVYAPLPSYRAETLPAIREAIVEGRSEFAGLQIRRLGERLEAATAAAKAASGGPGPRPTPRKK
jgi:N-acetylated-alpha-linked acidic dipeptidase